MKRWLAKKILKHCAEHGLGRYHAHQHDKARTVIRRRAR